MTAATCRTEKRQLAHVYRLLEQSTMFRIGQGNYDTVSYLTPENFQKKFCEHEVEAGRGQQLDAPDPGPHRG
jgi:hypothetical protein